MTGTTYALAELNKETTIGGQGTTVAREVPTIDMADFANRKARIADALWEASTEIGFFQVFNHGIPQEDIDAAFDTAWEFFELPREVKAQYPMPKGTNAGWEFKAQVRPSTGTPDNKESYQITRPNMPGLWPSEDELPGFRAKMLRFERQNWELGMRILSCFALKMGFAEDFFTRAHDPDSDQYQSTLRLIHYMSMENAKPEDFKAWRAGAHSDFDCLTILHQKEGEGGLQVCPGKDAASGQWTDVPPGLYALGPHASEPDLERVPSNSSRILSYERSPAATVISLTELLCAPTGNTMPAVGSVSGCQKIWRAATSTVN